MRARGLTALFVLFFLPSAASAQSKLGPLAILSGGTAFADYEVTSADGCKHTSGQVILVQARTGFYLENGVHVSGATDNSCTNEYSGFAGYAKGKWDVVTLGFAHFQGTLVTQPYYDGDFTPATMELDLWWIGHGAVTHEQGVYRDGSTIDFHYSAQRAATTKGTLTLDGDVATVSSARLFDGTQGQLTLPQP